MKMTISWHQECLANYIKNHRKKRMEALITLEKCNAAHVECEAYAKQIAEAKLRGMTEFDRDRLLRKRL